MKERLKELRKTLGLKQREIAEKLGVNVGLIGTWESGGQPIPKTRIYQICNEYGVNREWLENGVGDMFRPGATEDEALKIAALALFDQLSDKGKKAVVKALEEYNAKNAGRKSAQKSTQKTDRKSQTNYGTIRGDMVQN